MEKVNGKVQMYVQIITFLFVWILVLIFTQPNQTWDLINALKEVPTAISIYAVLSLLFVKWLWRIPILHPWLVKIPNLNGTWRGVLKSDWVNPVTGKNIEPIPVLLTIKQDFSNLHCVLMTKESTSYSVVADINFGLGGDTSCLSYTYTNRSKASIRDRSPIHDGAAILKIIKNPQISLEGEYWTSRKTKGDINVILESRKIVESYIEV
ncbi:MAG: hypothetical protein V4480_03070 [Patescibacteria group bacterium]